MTDSPKPAGEAAPTPVILDAVAGHLRRTVKHFEQEALLLASALRETDATLHAERAKTAAMEAKLAALQADAGDA